MSPCAMLLPLVVLSHPSRAEDPAALAPGPKELEAAADALEARLDEADATSRSIARIHNRLAEIMQSRGEKLECGDPALVLVARTPAFGNGHRHRLQAARAARARMDRIAATPTAGELASTVLGPRLQTLRDRVVVHEDAFAEMLTWQAQVIDPLLRRCAPALVPGPAPDAPDLPVARTDLGYIAVVGIGGGLVCPAAALADGRVIVLEEPAACYTTSSTCDCQPLPTESGAVIGP